MINIDKGDFTTPALFLVLPNTFLIISKKATLGDFWKAALAICPTLTNRF